MTADQNVARLLTVFRLHRRLIIGVTLAGTCAIALAAQIIPPKYTAKAEVVVESAGPPTQVGQVLVAPAPLDPATILTEVTALTSQDLLRQAYNLLRADPKFLSPSAKATPGKGGVGQVDAQSDPGDGAWTWLAPVLSAAGKPFDWVRTRLSGADRAPSFHDFVRDLRVFQEAGSHVVAVAFTSTSPRQAAMAANAIVQQHLRYQEQQAKLATTRGLTWLDQQIPLAQRSAQLMEADEARYSTAHNLPAAGTSGVLDTEFADLDHELVTAEADLAARKQSLASARQLVAHNGSLDTDAAPLNVPVLAELQSREAALLDERARSGFTMAASSPVMLRIDRQLREVRREMTRATGRAVSGLESGVTVAAARVQLLNNQLKILRGRLHDPKLQEMERATSFELGLVDSLMKRRQSLREQLQSYSSGVRILSLAMPPDRPSSINPILFVPPALILSFVGAAMLGLFIDTLDTTFRTERALRETLRLPCLGFVPKVRRRGQKHLHQLLISEPYSPYTESIRCAAAGLRLVQSSGTAGVILVTSSVPGEGKTTFAVSLATFASMMGKRVLLMDLDLRHPSVLRELGGAFPDRAPDLGGRRQPAEDVAQKVPGLDLDYLSVRRGSADSLKLVAGEDMQRLIDGVRRRYDCVVIDSAPVLAMAEARLLAAMADKVVLVVKWAATRSDIVQNAVDVLRSPGLAAPGRAENIAAVITQVDLKKHARQCAGDLAEIAMKYRSYYAALEGP